MLSIKTITITTANSAFVFGRKDMTMTSQLLKTTLLALPVAGLLALTPVAFAHDYGEYDYESPHARMHDSLEAQHEAAHEDLEAQHETAHQYPMTRREHRALHQALRQE